MPLETVLEAQDIHKSLGREGERNCQNPRRHFLCRLTRRFRLDRGTVGLRQDHASDVCLAGLMPIDGGAVSFEGHDVKEPLPGIAVVFQDYSRSLLPWRRNVGNVMFGMKRNTGMPAAEKERVARELLAQVGLRGYEDH